MKISHIFAVAFMALATTSCNDFIDITPTGVISGDDVYKEPEKMVNSAYAMLGDCWFTYPFNLWPYGDLTSDDCLKGGSGTTDTDYHHLEMWSSLTASNPGHTDELWYRLYCAISRCNRALIALDANGDAALGQDTANRRRAEVRFLRGHFYYKLLTLFRKIPWIDESTVRNASHEQTRNDEFTYEELFAKVIADFQFAYDNLETTSVDGGGRTNKVAAAAYLAKCYLNLAWGDGYEATTGPSHINLDYMQKVVDYTGVVANSQYGYLEDFGDIFLPEYKNSKESVFAVQTSQYTEDNTNFGRCNWSNMLNGCWGMWSCGWDFHKPSQNLVNAFKTRNGLPMFDDFNNTIDYPVQGKPSAQKWDPRLFHTVGMPTWPYKYEAEYTMTKDNSRTPNTYGYYTSLKDVPQRSKGETFNGSWQAFAMNDYVFRYTDVMLMRAEALVELDRYNEALAIINDIRTRAANSISKHIGYAADYCEISNYPAGYITNREIGRKCVRWERRLELAMESGRFFDLRRWGIASETLNAYFASEKNDSYDGQSYAGYLEGAHFTPGKNEFFPVPFNQLYYVPGLYTQVDGYN